MYEEKGSERIKYIYAGSQRVAQISSIQGTSYFTNDHLGSASLMTDTNGVQVQSMSYLPFGGTFQSAGTKSSAWRYTGQRQDDSTGLYYYNARYYDPTIGRFLTPDTIVQAPYDPQTLNRYAYCRNNPINLVDPTGHWSDEYPYDPIVVTATRLPYRLENDGGRAEASMREAAKRQAQIDYAKNREKSERNLELKYGEPGLQHDPIIEEVILFGPAAVKGLFGLLRGGFSFLFAEEGAVLLGKEAAEGFINPNAVRFRQDTAKASFRNGGTIQEMADGLRSGALRADSVPAIRLVEREGKLFTLDNRRLEAFQRAGMDRCV